MKLSFLQTVLLTILLHQVHAAVFRTSHATLRHSSEDVSVRKSLKDRKDYEYSTFQNGLKVLAVHDPKASKSGFAVAVSSGSFYDPVELPGLAHFCEHLLFLGTKKFPDEASFDSFLSQHDGSNNAYTEQERTVFYNEISHAGFSEGMDRFAQFFISPLFKQELVGRELNAVNSEHLKNVPDQGRKMWELMRSIARNTSVVNKFYTGTVDSLHHGDAKTVTALKKYHSENYCAPRMTLVMISNMTLSEQLSVAHKYFDAVPQGGSTCSPSPKDFSKDQPFADADSLGRFLQLRSDSVPQLWMMFPLPPVLKAYKAQPATFLEYQLGYAGPKSLKSTLKSKGLISDLNLQVDASAASTLVFVMFDLTHSGTKDVKLLTSLVFDYLHKVRLQSSDTVDDVYRAMQKMSLVTFDYQEAPDSVMDLVSALANNMMLYDPADVLAGDTTIDVMEPALVAQLMSKLSPTNVNLALATKDFDEVGANKRNQYYSVHYADGMIPDAWRSTWSQFADDADMRPPPALKYVPSNLGLLSATAGEVPQQLDKAGGVELWWLGKGLFPLPKVQMRVKLTVPSQLFSTPEYAAMRKLHTELSNQGLEEPMEDLGACGLEWTLSDSSDGYQLSMDGYSEHIAALVSHVAAGIYQPPTDEKRFQQARQKLVDALEDTTSKMPYEHAMEALSVLSTNAVFSRIDMIAALNSVKLDAFKAYLADLHTHGLRIQSLVTGNVDELGARTLAKTLADGLGVLKIVSKTDAAKSRAVRGEGAVQVRMANPIPHDSNNAVVNAYQFGVPDVADRVKLLMLGKMISQPAYDELRTKQQLGYVVFAIMVPHLSTLEMAIIVQGAKKAPDDIDLRIEGVLDDFSRSLKNISSTEFLKWKAALRSTINKKDENMAQEADRLWSHISSDELCFERQKMALDFLDSMHDPSEVAAEFENLRSNPRKFSVRMFGAQAVNQTKLQHPMQQNASSFAAASSEVVVYDDSQADKKVVAKAQDFWPDAAICKVHR
jgi:insulysin